MPDTKTGEGTRLLTEDEAYAIAANEVKRELAKSEETVTGLRASLEEKSNEFDALTVREVALKDELAALQTEFDSYKAEIAAEKERAERTDSRIASLREAATTMPDEFFSDPARIERIVAMSDEDFTSYISDIGSVAKVKAPEASGTPRESAMKNQQKQQESGEKVSALKKFVEATVGV